MTRCPHCKELVNRFATKCKHCHSDLTFEISLFDICIGLGIFFYFIS